MDIRGYVALVVWHFSRFKQVHGFLSVFRTRLYRVTDYDSDRDLHIGTERKEMITLKDYLMGRDEQYPDEYTETIATNAQSTVDAVNPLLDDFFNNTGISLGVASGWRPKAVNDATSNAGAHSRHITAQAVDIRDTPARDLARWVAANQHKLQDCGLYCERFEWTPTWVHFSPYPPASGKEFYIPSTAPAMVARLDEQNEWKC